MSTVVVAEKPSVARDIAATIGATGRGEGYLHGNGHVVTWAIGHLVGLAEPNQIDARWRAWRRDQLPMLPRAWPLVVMPQTQAQFTIVRNLINDPRNESLICATDAGREGELIFRLIYEAARCRKPVRRLWLSSMTPDAIRAAFRALRDSREYDRLAAAARGRAQADWLVGMNLTRAYTLMYDDKLSVGRVQTPTLALIVQREKEILAFVPEDYIEIVATFAPASGQGSYTGTWFRQREGQKQADAVRDGRRLPADGVEAGRIVARVKAAAQGRIESLAEETKRMPPPLLYDLTELQRHANRSFGFTAQKTLEIAQRLYEHHKLISYPRTDSRHLSNDVAATLPAVVATIAAPYRNAIAPGTGARPLPRRFVDDSKVTDHHAIIPTATSPRAASLDEDERRIYDLVCRRLLAAWHDDHIWAVTTVITAVDSIDPAEGATTDRFHTTGSLVVQQGWKVLDSGSAAGRRPASRESSDDPQAGEDIDLPPGLAEGQRQDVRKIETRNKQTRPPRRYTEATLLTAMETAGKMLDDEELSRAMRDCGLGTPATRAGMIETLLDRSYIVREAKSLKPTQKGIHLIDVVHPHVKSPAMTGEWEAKLRAIERGEVELPRFMHDIEEYVRKVVSLAFTVPRPTAAPAPAPLRSASVAAAQRPPSGTPPPPPLHPQPPAQARQAVPPAAPTAGDATDLKQALRQFFGFESFRPHQEAVCRSAVAGDDILLVMPTGAGKSLCYQLPGMIRGGTTLVVSPLIALMEDQVAKLSESGLRAERIHSGRDRSTQRAVLDDYLAGRLDFLFIAPERLSVPGFPEKLSQRPPSLVAIDEAHCISHWGHDFRPDYRMLGERIPQFRPAPVMALTATATPIVQKDIVGQLGLRMPRHFIHGFRRENLAIEVVEVPKPERFGVVREMLLEPATRPAILYSPTRKDAEALAERLARDFPAGAYHAGMKAAARDSIQNRFASSELDVVVATIAFGMGIDKADVRTVVHLALPQTIEGYYQEIGRAGRDGALSRAVLMHSYADRKINEFLRNRQYPEVETLDHVFRSLSNETQLREDVMRRSGVAEDHFDNALAKLWVHGGARIGAEDTVCRGHERWRESYIAQRAHRVAQEEQMVQYTRARGCRMLYLVRHFGDEDDPGHACRQCDNCGGSGSITRSYRPPTADEQAALSRILDGLRDIGSTSTGRLHGELFGSSGIDRQELESLLAALSRAGLATLTDETFEKDGRVIPYRRVRLSSAARTGERPDLSAIQIETGAVGRTRVAARSRKYERPPAVKASASARPEAATDADPNLVAALRSWRLTEAKKRGRPAFLIMSDRTLLAIAQRRPRDEDELLSVSGVGPAFLKKYAAPVLRIVGAS